jgi:hypothetical protein
MMLTVGAMFPPVVVFFDGAEYWLADGFHRILAAKQLGLAEIAADVREGGRANVSHGLKRFNRDKRNAVGNYAWEEGRHFAKVLERQAGKR